MDGEWACVAKVLCILKTIHVFWTKLSIANIYNVCLRLTYAQGFRIHMYMCVWCTYVNIPKSEAHFYSRCKKPFISSQEVRARELHYHLAVSCLNFNMIWLLLLLALIRDARSGARGETFVCITINLSRELLLLESMEHLCRRSNYKVNFQWIAFIMPTPMLMRSHHCERIIWCMVKM